jgi:CBS domain-containing protein
LPKRNVRLQQHDLPMAGDRGNGMFTSVRDVMSWQTRVIRPQMPATVALAILVNCQETELLIVDEQDHYVGTLTDYALLKAELNGTLCTETAGSLSVRTATCLAPDDTLSTALKLFREGQWTQLPVVRDRRLVGCLTRGHLLRWLADGSAERSCRTVPIAQVTNSAEAESATSASTGTSRSRTTRTALTPHFSRQVATVEVPDWS